MTPHEVSKNEFMFSAVVETDESANLNLYCLMSTKKSHILKQTCR